jgi:hypothetical protein
MSTPTVVIAAGPLHHVTLHVGDQAAVLRNDMTPAEYEAAEQALNALLREAIGSLIRQAAEDMRDGR